MRKFFTAILLGSIFLLPTFAFSAPLILPEYEAAKNLTLSGSCDAGKTQLKLYEGMDYLLMTIAPSDGTIFYVLDNNSDDYHFLIKNLGNDVVELTKDDFLKRLSIAAPNEFKRVMRQENDCSAQENK